MLFSVGLHCMRRACTNAQIKCHWFPGRKARRGFSRTCLMISRLLVPAELPAPTESNSSCRLPGASSVTLFLSRRVVTTCGDKPQTRNLQRNLFRLEGQVRRRGEERVQVRQRGGRE